MKPSSENSSAYCDSSHSSSRPASTALSPFALPPTAAAAASLAASLPPAAAAAALPLSSAGPNRPSSCPVSMFFREMLSALTTALATSSLKRCMPMIFSSSVSRMRRRYTLTVRFCPSRWARSIAWRSFCGFQSCSRNTTVSAVVRLRPRPPTPVVSSRTSMVGSALKRCATSKRLLAATLPSRRRNDTPPGDSTSRSTRSSRPRSCANTRTRCPRLLSAAAGSPPAEFQFPIWHWLRMSLSASILGASCRLLRCTAACQPLGSAHPQCVSSAWACCGTEGSMTSAGWLHSLRRYCSAWNTCGAAASPAGDVSPWRTSLATELAANCSYSAICSGDMAQYTSWMILGGRSLSTWSLVRRSTKGMMVRCSASAASSPCSVSRLPFLDVLATCTARRNLELNCRSVPRKPGMR
mmetsp:Transcript_23235/g.58622  ORF Transcript_23235/g.58622 Transcript_23235/m.58622 type:complete len:411 (+) Transcript_23235:171-1403(+)